MTFPESYYQTGNTFSEFISNNNIFRELIPNNNKLFIVDIKLYSYLQGIITNLEESGQ